MSVKENKDLVTRFIKEGNAAKGNVTKSLVIIEKYVDPQFVEHIETGDMNLEQYKQLSTALYKAFPDLDFIIEDIVAEGDKVVIRFIFRGTHKGEFMGIAPTEKKFTEAGITIFRITGRKVAEAWAVHDTFGLMQQLGAIPSR
jgi:predicted ester cyclase